ncbi:MAG: hypothetical protein AAGC46_21515 [Solirubrobacteraceae bacterium]
MFDIGTADRAEDLVTRRARHYLATAHPSSMVAETPSGELVAVALTRQLGSRVFLAWAAVRETFQNRGIMRAMLDAFPAGAPGLQRTILCSTDPKAMRRYSLLGLPLHPTVSACGILRPGAVQTPTGAIESSVAEAEAVLEPIAEAVRGSGYAIDIPLMDAQGDRAHVVDGAVAIRAGGIVRALVARTPEAGALALRAALAAAPSGATIHVNQMRAGQDWAIREALAAGLPLSPDGPIFSDPPLSPLHLPNGSWC